MHLDRTRAQEQLAGDLPIGPSGGHHPDDLDLSAGQTAVLELRGGSLPEPPFGPLAQCAERARRAGWRAALRRVVEPSGTRRRGAPPPPPAGQQQPGRPPRGAAIPRVRMVRRTPAAVPARVRTGRWPALRSRRSAQFRPEHARAQTSAHPDQRRPRSERGPLHRHEYRRHRRTRRRTSWPSAVVRSQSVVLQSASTAPAGPSSDRPPTASPPPHCPQWLVPNRTAAPSPQARFAVRWSPLPAAAGGPVWFGRASRVWIRAGRWRRRGREPRHRRTQ